MSINMVAWLRGLLLQRLLADDPADVDEAARYYLRSLSSPR